MDANKKMKTMLENLASGISEKLVNLTVLNLQKIMSPQFTQVYDSIIVSRDKIEISEEQYSRVIKMHGDKTGYEASNNDTRVNDFFETDLPGSEALSIALMIVDVWGGKLKCLEPESDFCFIIDCDENYVTLRFHKLRSNEGMWLLDDIEGYDGAIGYIIV